MKALLETRMMGGEPPESFQVHLGRELIDSHVVAGRMEPLDDLYAEEGWNEVFPKDLIDIASYDGQALVGAGQHSPLQRAVVSPQTMLETGRRHRRAQDLG